MPKYFFDLIGKNVMKDRTGIELSSDAAACREAILRGIDGTSLESQQHSEFESIIVRGASGSVICAAPIRRKR